MVHCLITEKENYCALRPQSYELHTVEGVFFIPYCISFLLRLIVHSAPIVWGSVRRTAVFIRSLCYFRPPSCEGPYDGRRYLIPHCMGEEHFGIVDSRLRDITSAEHLRNFLHTFVHIEERHRARCALSSLLLQHFIMVTAN